MNKLHQDLHLCIFSITKGEGRTTIQEPTLQDIVLALSKSDKTIDDIPGFNSDISLFNQTDETKEYLLNLLSKYEL